MGATRISLFLYVTWRRGARATLVSTCTLVAIKQTTSMSLDTQSRTTPAGSTIALKDAASKPSGEFRGWNKVDGTLMKLLLAGNTYIDIHTKKHPDGEIRGQLLIVDHVDQAVPNPKGRR